MKLLGLLLVAVCCMGVAGLGPLVLPCDCPSGWHCEGGRCVRDKDTCPCPRGWHCVGLTCVKDNDKDTCPCPPGWHCVDLTCVKDKEIVIHDPCANKSCPKGKTCKNGECVFDISREQAPRYCKQNSDCFPMRRCVRGICM